MGIVACLLGGMWNYCYIVPVFFRAAIWLSKTCFSMWKPLLGIAAVGLVGFVMHVVSCYFVTIASIICFASFVIYHWNQAGFEAVLRLLFDSPTETKLTFLFVSEGVIAWNLHTLLPSVGQVIQHVIMLHFGTLCLVGYSVALSCADFYDELQERFLGTIIVTAGLLVFNIERHLAMLFHGCIVVVIVGVMANAQLHRNYLYRWDFAWQYHAWIGVYFQCELVHELHVLYIRYTQNPTNETKLKNTGAAGHIRNTLKQKFRMEFQRHQDALFVPKLGWDVYLRPYRRYKIWLFQLCALYVYCFCMFWTYKATGYEDANNMFSDWPGLLLGGVFTGSFFAGSQTCFVIAHKIKIDYTGIGVSVSQDATIRSSMYSSGVTVQLSEKPHDVLKRWAIEHDPVYLHYFTPTSRTYLHTVNQCAAHDFPETVKFLAGVWTLRAANVTQARHKVRDACVTACADKSPPICRAICDSVSKHIGESKCSELHSSLIKVAEQAGDP